MSLYPVNTIETAPEQSKPSMEGLNNAFGFIPNLIGAMSNSPILLSSLVGLFGKVHGGSFPEPQIQIVLLTDAVTNGAAWAVAFHSALALGQGVSEADVEAIRAGRLPSDPKFAALSHLAKTLIEKRGRIDQQEIENFVAAGFDKSLVLEIVAIVAASTITNYTASITQPPLEEKFQAHAWNA
jgi:alkylhydroperoxidase family enzyme